MVSKNQIPTTAHLNTIQGTPLTLTFMHCAPCI